MKLVLENITQSHGTVRVLENISLEVQPGEFFLLLGASGCGKTTLLRTVAGFHKPQSGSVKFDSRDVTTLAAHERNVGMVFQNYALFPHMNVHENIAYGLKLRKTPADELNKRVGEILQIVRMEGYAHRLPSELSGGQQQRVALARALVIRPDLILFDEPLSNLDARLRVELRGEIRRIQRETGVTALYVTHDQEEAVALADRMAVMNRGRIEQLGTPVEIYRRPSSRFVADFLGDTNWIAGVVTANDHGQGRVKTELGEWAVSLGEQFKQGNQVMCGIRPEALVPKAGQSGHFFKGRIVSRSFRGAHEEIKVAVASGEEWKVRAGRFASDLTVGGNVEWAISADEIMVVPENKSHLEEA